MEKELRKKFIIVTIILISLVFGIFFVVNNIYYRYWDNIDTLKFLNWITESDILLSEPYSSAGREFIEFNDESGKISAFKVYGNTGIYEKIYADNAQSQKVSYELLKNIIDKGNEYWMYKHFIYKYKKLPDNSYLIVLSDTSPDREPFIRYIISASMIICCILILFAIISYLSHYVTKPANLAMQREKQFIADASHELKTPLGAISINAQALEMIYDDEKHINNILRESERMQRLIEKLLTLSKLEENTAAEKKIFSLSSCVEEMALTYESVAYEKEVSYYYEISENIDFNGVEDDVRQLIAILIDNAIKNTEISGEIKINLSKNGSRKNFCIENTGKGIQPDEIPHIFERFYKSDKSRNGNSFGLGLAIAKAIAERNNCVISVESEPYKLTKFTIEF